MVRKLEKQNRAHVRRKPKKWADELELEFQEAHLRRGLSVAWRLALQENKSAKGANHVSEQADLDALSSLVRQSAVEGEVGAEPACIQAVSSDRVVVWCDHRLPAAQDRDRMEKTFRNTKLRKSCPVHSVPTELWRMCLSLIDRHVRKGLRA